MGAEQANLNDDTTTPTLFKLATRPKHVFGPRERVSAHESPSGHEQHEWKCQCCPLFKITVLPRGREGYRVYRYGADGVQFEDSHEPGCGVGAGAVAERGKVA